MLKCKYCQDNAVARVDTGMEFILACEKHLSAANSSDADLKPAVGWREESDVIRLIIRERVLTELTYRMDKGVLKYGGDGFKGNPLQHLFEEQIDSLFYTMYLERLINYLLDIAGLTLEDVIENKELARASQSGEVASEIPRKAPDST